MLLPAEVTADKGNGEVACGRQPQRMVEPQNFDPNDRCQKRSTHRTEHIGQIQETKAFRLSAIPFPDVSHHKWKGRPHAHTPGQDGSRQNQGGKGKVAERIRLAGGQQQVFAHVKQARNGESSQPDQ